MSSVRFTAESCGHVVVRGSKGWSHVHSDPVGFIGMVWDGSVEGTSVSVTEKKKSTLG